jgi:hypothetical protein
MTEGARLFALLPAIFRSRDAEQALAIAAEFGFAAADAASPDLQGPLTSLLAALEQQLTLLEAQVDQLYDDQFVETCAPWVIPYIGALVGARIVDLDDAGSARRQVADTIRNRRTKGTAGALAAIAGDIMDAPAEAIEYREHLVTTLNLDFPSDGRAMSAAINGASGRAMTLPDFIGQRSVELRDMREGGRFAAPNLGTRVWQTRALPHNGVVPVPVTGGDPGRFLFSAIGGPVKLWRKPLSDDEARTRLSLDETPGPIPLRDASGRPEAYYGETLSVLIHVNGLPVPRDGICFCDLSDRNAAGTSWNDRGSAEELALIRIDPQLGRLAVPNSMLGLTADAMRLHFHYGQAIEAGGGGYAEAQALPASAATVAASRTRAEVTADFAAAAEALDANPEVRIDYGGTFAPPSATALPGQADVDALPRPQGLADGGVRSITIAAGADAWPTLELAGSWTFTGGSDATLVLRGLRLIGRDLVIATTGLRKVLLIDCTLVPGLGQARDGTPVTPGGVGLRVQQPGCRVVIERCVVGAIRLEPTAELSVIDSVVDSAGADAPAIAALDGTAGGLLSAERSTIIGDVAVTAVGEIGNSLFLTRTGRTNAGSPVFVARIQSGCVRYSALPPKARVPRRYRCYPDEAEGDAAGPVPASLRYGEAAYASLVAASPEAILTGAENGGEMGVMNRFSWHRRMRLLNRELPGWTPFAMVARGEFMSE